MLTTRHKMHGLTLIEVMIAVVLFGLLMALGAGSFSSWIQNQQTRTAAESVLNGLQMARGEAVKRNAATVFMMCDLAAGNTGSSWDILAASQPASDTLCGPTAGAATGWERVQQRSFEEGSRNVIATPLGGGNAIGFNGFGRVVTLAGVNVPPAAKPVVQGLTQIDLNNPKGNRQLSVTVTTGGAVRMCDPSPTLAAGDTRRCNN